MKTLLTLILISLSINLMAITTPKDSVTVKPIVKIKPVIKVKVVKATGLATKWHQEVLNARKKK